MEAQQERERANLEAAAAIAARDGAREASARANAAEELANQRVNELEQVTEFQATQLRDIDPEKMAVDLRAPRPG